jgi:molybdopterin synthase sulfur carrier subunit
VHRRASKGADRAAEVLDVKVEVEFFSRLKDVVGASQLEIELPGNATVHVLIGRLIQLYPSLREWDRSILVGAGVEFVNRNDVLKAGDKISIMPPVQGG